MGQRFLTSKVDVERGVRQGDPLSPLLYNFSINLLINKLNKHLQGIKINGQKCVKCFAFADDCVVAASSGNDVDLVNRIFR